MIKNKKNEMIIEFNNYNNRNNNNNNGKNNIIE